MPIDRQAVGQRGEDLAADHLVGIGYRILERNFRCAAGEIDIVAEHQGTLVVVEVRTRRGAQFGTPAESITSHKAARLVALEKHYRMARTGLPQRSRIDVVSVELGRGSMPARITVIENAVEDG